MFNLKTVLGAWKLQLIGGAIIVAAAGWWHIHATTVAYEKGQKSGVEKGWKDAEAQQKTQWAAEREKIAADRQSLIDADHQLKIQRAEIDRARLSLQTELNRTLDTIAAKNQENRTDVSQIDPQQLVPRLRDVLRTLSAIERQRAGRGGPIAQQ